MESNIDINQKSINILNKENEKSEKLITKIKQSNVESKNKY